MTMNRQKSQVINKESVKIFPMKLSCMNEKDFLEFFSNFIWDIQKLCAQLTSKTWKKRYVPANQASFINSKLHKEIMRNTLLRNKLINFKANADRIAYNKNVIIVLVWYGNEKRPISIILKYMT